MISLTIAFALFFSTVVRCEPAAGSSKEQSLLLRRLLPTPTKYAVEAIGVKFLDALIKKAQMEMAKGAFKTQLDVLEKVHPDQYRKYKKLKIEDLAADAVFQQAEMAKLQPKTGNAFVDMLNENGIPIASSLKGIEQAIKTQREIETQDPTEQIATAVLEKFRTQILPGLVANMIAGRNPFKMPQQMRQAQEAPEVVRQQAEAARMASTVSPEEFYGRRMPVEQGEMSSAMEASEMPPEIRRSEGINTSRRLIQKLQQSPRLRALLENEELAEALSFHRRMHDERRPLADDEDDEEMLRKKTQLDGKGALLLGLHDIFDDDDGSSDNALPEIPNPATIRRAPSLSSSFIEKLGQNDKVRKALEQLTFSINDVDEYLAPKKLAINPNPQAGYMVPRRIPKKARKMIPLLIGLDSKEQEEIRRNPSIESFQFKKSRVINNLKNNPGIAPLFMDGTLEQKLTGREILTPEQKGRTRVKLMKTNPRLLASKTFNPMDAQVSQMIEERPVPPVNFTPKGRHTRIRWTSANEREIPGIGGRFILPSLDPTMPAVNTAYSTQGRARDEMDTIFKVPNNWNPGDEVGFSVKQKSERFVGGNGGFDMPALQFN